MTFVFYFQILCNAMDYELMIKFEPCQAYSVSSSSISSSSDCLIIFEYFSYMFSARELYYLLKCNFRQRQLRLQQQQLPQRLRPRRRQKLQHNQPTSAVQQAFPIQQHSNLFWPLFHLSYCFSHFKCCQSVAKLFCALACSL